MSTYRKIPHRAADPKTGITLDEMAAFVQEAMREEVAGDAVVYVDGGTLWSDGMRGVRVDEEADAKRIAKAARKAAKAGTDQPSEETVVASNEALREGLERGEYRG